MAGDALLCGDQPDASGLLELLARRGYATLWAENSCSPTPLNPPACTGGARHGDQLRHFFCQPFERPNCIGGKSAAQHLLDYTTSFIDKYRGRAVPWVARDKRPSGHLDGGRVFVLWPRGSGLKAWVIL